MGKVKFDINNLEEIIQRGFSMDHVILLTWIQEGVSLDIPSRGNKIQAVYQSLIRKGLVDKDKLTTLGEDLLVYMETKDPNKLTKKRTPAEKKIVETSDFLTWWKAYPGTPNFTYKGMQFEGDRSIRVNQDMCAVKFASIISEGEHTGKDLLDALNYEVLQKKEASVKEKTNKLKYMQNSLTYLNQRTFEPFVELIKSGAKIETSSIVTRGGTDI